MSLQGLVDATDAALGGARELFGPAATAAGLTASSGLPALRTAVQNAADTLPAGWQGSGSAGYRATGTAAAAALDAVSGADARLDPQLLTAADQSRAGRAGMTSVLADTRAGVSAIAPSTDTPAGKAVLVDHLQNQLHRAKTLLMASEQRSQLLATLIRTAGGGYAIVPRSGGPRPQSPPTEPDTSQGDAFEQCLDDQYWKHVGLDTVKNGFKSALTGALAGAVGGGTILPGGAKPVGALGGGVMGFVGGFAQGVATSPAKTLAAAVTHCVAEVTQ